MRTSELMNSRIVMTVDVLFGGAKSCKIDLITRVMMLQQRVSRIRSACVQNSMTGSNMFGEDRTKLRTEPGVAVVPSGLAVLSVSSRQVMAVRERCHSKR